MAVLELKYFPADVLKTKTAAITQFGTELAKIADDMAETMYVEEGIGLAANQVGLSLAMFVMDIPQPQGEGEGAKRVSDLRTFINPELLEKSGEIIWQEGCLSVPGVDADVKR
ncbi:MAG: peptide deformylase, partial [Myxococcota bacterium]